MVAQELRLDLITIGRSCVDLYGEQLGGPARRVAVLALGGEWADVTTDCRDNTIPPEVVQRWSRQNEQSLVTFRLSG